MLIIKGLRSWVWTSKSKLFPHFQNCTSALSPRPRALRVPTPGTVSSLPSSLHLQPGIFALAVGFLQHPLAHICLPPKHSMWHAGGQESHLLCSLFCFLNPNSTESISKYYWKLKPSSFLNIRKHNYPTWHYWYHSDLWKTNEIHLKYLLSENSIQESFIILHADTLPTKTL